jgi:hypothetical protein
MNMEVDMPVANLNGFTKAKKRLIERGQFDYHNCMDFLECLGITVGALGNEEIVQLTREILKTAEQVERIED